MKLVPLLISILVAASLYAIVFERDRLFDLAGRETAAETPTQQPGTPAEAALAEQSMVRVVAIDSVASEVGNAVHLRGQTEAARRIDVRAETSGLIVSEPLRKGTLVDTGDVLCTIDPGTRPAQLAEAKAKLAEAEIGDNAAQRLAEGGYGSETQKLSARAALQGAEAAVEIAETEIEQLTILAPFSGVLETDTAELGSLMQPGSDCATILKLDPIKLVGFLAESSVNVVKEGAEAKARLSSGREIYGKVTFLSRSADPTTRTFRIEVTVENADLSIRDGQSADIDIAAAGVEAHLVPQSALTLDDAGEMGLRLLDNDNVVSFAPVRVVRDTLDGMYVTGLPEAARIVVVGQEFVTDGVKVDVTLRGANG